jgi:hypothetical protein
VDLNTWSIPASKDIFMERQQVYGDTGVTEVGIVMGSIYLDDCGVSRHYLISISSYHTKEIHTLSFPNFSLTHSVWDFLDPCNCTDPQCQIVSDHLALFLRSSSQNPSLHEFRLDAQWACPDAPLIMLKYHLWPDWLYVNIERPK